MAAVVGVRGATDCRRRLGMLLSGRIAIDGDLFRWLECVAYAMVTGLIARVLVMPSGTLALTPLLRAPAAPRQWC